MRRIFVLVVVALALGSPAAAAPVDPSAPQYYFDQWHVPELWRSGARGAGITIAEIDTGVDAKLPELVGRVHRGKDFGRFGGTGGVDRDKNPYGHGTSMASIILGRTGQLGIRGLAPGAKIVPVAIPLDGTTDEAGDDRLAAAIRWSAGHGANIITMSLGGVRRPARNADACPPDEQQAIFAALRKGALVLAAAGNRGRSDDAIEEPGVCLGVVSVGAVDSSGSVAPFSSRQPYLTMSAPGVDIASIGPGDTPFAGSGTSQATAVASAAAALVWSKFPQLTAAQLLSRLLTSADRHAAGHSRAYGYGTINPYRAITSHLATDAHNPVYDVARPFVVADAAPRRDPVPSTPAAAQRASRPPGEFVVGTASSRSAHHRAFGIVLAGIGAIALLALLIGGATTRRRRHPSFGVD